MKKLMISLALCLTLPLGAMAQDAKATFANRFDGFVKELATHDTLSVNEKNRVDSTYQAYLEEYSVIQDSLTDEDVRKCSKAKVRYQKEKARLFANKTSEKVANTADDIGQKVSKIFRRTKKKVQGAVDALKND